MSPKKEKIPYRALNIGRGKPVKLMKFINLIEKNLKLKAKIKFKNLQKGDIKGTHSDIGKLYKLINFKPKIETKTGVKKFLDWYKSYFKIKM